MTDAKRLVGGKRTTTDLTTYRCAQCGSHTTPNPGVPDECRECEAPLSDSDRVDQTPAIECPKCGEIVPADGENRSWFSELPTFICPKCNDHPILAIQQNGEVKSPLAVLSINSLSVTPQTGTPITSNVYASTNVSTKDLPVVQLLNIEAKSYDESFTGYSITDDETNSILVYTDDIAIGYVTWTREPCADGVDRPIVQQLFILQNFWREGIGSALTTYVLDTLPELDESVWLNSPNVHMMNVLDRLGLVGLDDDGNLEIDESCVGITGSSITGVKQYIRRKQNK